MAFKLKTAPITAEATITVHHPADGEITFTGKFQILKQSQYQTLVQGKKDDFQIIREVMIGWSGVTDEEGRDKPFTSDALSELCAYSFVRTGIMRAYTDLHVGLSAPKN